MSRSARKVEAMDRLPPLAAPGLPSEDRHAA
jgi:hypothetical protein